MNDFISFKKIYLHDDVGKFSMNFEIDREENTITSFVYLVTDIVDCDIHNTSDLAIENFSKTFDNIKKSMKLIFDNALETLNFSEKDFSCFQYGFCPIKEKDKEDAKIRLTLWCFRNCVKEISCEYILSITQKLLNEGYCISKLN